MAFASAAQQDTHVPPLEERKLSPHDVPHTVLDVVPPSSPVRHSYMYQARDSADRAPHPSTQQSYCNVPAAGCSDSATSVCLNAVPPIPKLKIDPRSPPTVIPSHLMSPDAAERHQTESPRARVGRMSEIYFEWRRKLSSQVLLDSIPITPWAQSAFKLVFSDAFESTIDLSEIQAMLALLAGVVINTVVVILNLFVDPPQFAIASTQVAATIVFVFEFTVVMLMWLIMTIALAHALWKGKITTGLAVDVVDMCRVIGEFSSLLTVRIVSPTFVIETVLPVLTAAASPAEIIRGVAIVMLWVVGVFLAAVCLVLKVSQVGFVSKYALTEWSVTNFSVMFGLMLNLSKLDGSYDSVSIALLSSIHKNFAGPGRIIGQRADKSRSLYAKARRTLGLEKGSKFAIFGTIFNYHFGDDSHTFDNHMRWQDRLRKFLNFFSFVAKLDNNSLLRFLQMVESPMLHYRHGREVFERCFREGDVAGMELALWTCDPEAEEVKSLAETFPHAFELTYHCSNTLIHGDGVAL